ncbi:hypothetical protein, partial [Mesorhizobium sp.]|uniref:hypothetical protein n=1 Tax=Mesorhizobium sp. TaxID=1871066 RepID=UPI0025BC6869
LADGADDLGAVVGGDDGGIAWHGASGLLVNRKRRIPSRPALTCQRLMLAAKTWTEKTRRGGGSSAQISTMDKIIAWLPSPGNAF